MDDSEKITKLLRTLPVSFDALGMVSSLGTNTFEEITNTVSANIENRKKLGNWKETAVTPLAHFAEAKNIQGVPFHRSVQGGSRGRGGRGRGV